MTRFVLLLIAPALVVALRPHRRGLPRAPRTYSERSESREAAVALPALGLTSILNRGISTQMGGRAVDRLGEGH